MSVTTAPTPTRGILSWFASTDHKRIAIRMAVTSTFFLAAAGVLILTVRTELVAPGMQAIGEDTFNQFFTIHGSTMVYIVVTPLALGLGLYFVPLQLGAAEVWAPRLALFGYWLVTLGGVTMWLGFGTDQGAGKAGWTAYYPLSGPQKTPGLGMDMWVVGVLLAGVGVTCFGLCVLMTILRRRSSPRPFRWKCVRRATG